MSVVVIEKATKNSQGGVKPNGHAAGECAVVDGHFAEAELIGGFWILQMRSMDEAIEWVRRCPVPMPGEETAGASPRIGTRGRRPSRRSSIRDH